MRTPRLLLRPFVLADVARIFALSREDGLRRWIPDQVYDDVAHAERVLRALIANTDVAPDPATRPWVLAVTEDDMVIGHVGLSAARGSVEIGYAIAEARSGTGLATEAVSAVAAWALADLRLPEVLGIVAADNVASCRVLAKAGFMRTGEDGARLIYRR